LAIVQVFFDGWAQAADGWAQMADGWPLRPTLGYTSDCRYCVVLLTAANTSITFNGPVICDSSLLQ